MPAPRAYFASLLVASSVSAAVSLRADPREGAPEPAKPPPGSSSLPPAPPPPPAPYAPPPVYSAPPPYAAPPPYWVPFTGYAGVPLLVDLTATEPGVTLQLFGERANPASAAPILVCSSPPCRVALHAGKYKLRVTETESTLAGTRSIELREPSVVTVDPDTTDHRSAGLAMGIAGPILAIVGLGLLLSSSCYDCEDSSSHEDTAALGALGLLGGLTITPIGWVMFGTSFKPEVEMTPLRSQPLAK